MRRTDLLTPDEVCDLLSISKKTLYGWTSRHEIPFIKLGRLLRFRREEIDQWLKDSEVPVFDPKTSIPFLARHGVTQATAGTAFHQAYLEAQRDQPGTPLFPAVRAFPGGGAPMDAAPEIKK